MKTQGLIEEFKKYDIGPYIEVPCSILAPIITYLLKDEDCEVLNPVSEAVAMGLAAGSYIATQKIPVLLIQNSGLCNTLNALTSLNQVYHIPLLYVISWRGEPGTKDAPEHLVMGLKTKDLLKTLNVPYAVLTEGGFKKEVREILKIVARSKRPAALILRRGVIEEESPITLKSSYGITRSKAVRIIMDAGHDKAYFVATNGLISRELFYHLAKEGIEEINAPFYMLGSMGHALPIALGLARYATKNKKIILLDGDGGCLMHLGSMVSVGKDRPRDLLHIILDNYSYASTGGQPSISKNIDFCKVAQGCGYKNIHRFADEYKLRKAFPSVLEKRGPTFVHILITTTNEKSRPRVSQSYSCERIKERFIKRFSQ